MRYVSFRSRSQRNNRGVRKGTGLLFALSRGPVVDFFPGIVVYDCKIRAPEDGSWVGQCHDKRSERLETLWPVAWTSEGGLSPQQLSNALAEVVRSAHHASSFVRIAELDSPSASIASPISGCQTTGPRAWSPVCAPDREPKAEMDRLGTSPF